MVKSGRKMSRNTWPRLISSLTELTIECYFFHFHSDCGWLMLTQILWFSLLNKYKSRIHFVSQSPFSYRITKNSEIFHSNMHRHIKWLVLRISLCFQPNPFTFTFSPFPCFSFFSIDLLILSRSKYSIVAYKHFLFMYQHRTRERENVIFERESTFVASVQRRRDDRTALKRNRQICYRCSCQKSIESLYYIEL